LVFADRGAVLVDTFITVEQIERLFEWVKAHGRSLSYIYLTYGHGNHSYGIEQPLKAFPGAHAVATAGTIALARIQTHSEQR
jgi:glyoxylase-like metal-dependent hydrolase (beta-lactamase superfamily II)